VQVQNAVALITGGAGGLGAGAARMITGGGGRVVLVDLPSSPGKELVAELGADSALFVPTDITDTDQVASAVEAALERFGRIDLCVNAAGVSPGIRTIDRSGNLFPLDTFRAAVEINLIGAFDVSRQAALAMTRNEPGEDGERGLIVQVSSIAAVEGQVGQTAYTASKAGLAAMVLPMARDLAPSGIRVMGVMPGIMDTPMLAGLDDKRRSALVGLSLFPKRLGNPADFAALVRSFMENTLLNADVVRLDAATRLV
jgi:3-hydroxyacyl-CoA dehydrogenase / 3-hydroxy-2-methylbutyryl-CoA dehydrogenase